MNIDQLFLYFTSTAAQVWGALMVFHILLIRDFQHKVDLKIEEIFADSRDKWHGFVEAIEGDKSYDLGKYNLNIETVKRAKYYFADFVILLSAIRKYDLILLGPDVYYTSEGRILRCSDLQTIINVNSDFLLDLAESRPNLKKPFILGTGAVFLNLFLMRLFIPSNCVIWFLSFSNFVLMILFVLSVWPVLVGNASANAFLKPSWR